MESNEQDTEQVDEAAERLGGPADDDYDADPSEAGGEGDGAPPEGIDKYRGG